MWEMTAIRVIFDGRAFVPQQPVSLAAESEAIVLVDQPDSLAQASLDGAVRAYYKSARGDEGLDADDDAWGIATAAQSHRAWDEE